MRGAKAAWANAAEADPVDGRPHRARFPGMGGADGAVVRIAIRAFDLEPPGERQIAEKGNDQFAVGLAHVERFVEFGVLRRTGAVNQDRKSTRLNSSH